MRASGPAPRRPPDRPPTSARRDKSACHRACRARSRRPGRCPSARGRSRRGVRRCPSFRPLQELPCPRYDRRRDRACDRRCPGGSGLRVESSGSGAPPAERKPAHRGPCARPRSVPATRETDPVSQQSARLLRARRELLQTRGACRCQRRSGTHPTRPGRSGPVPRACPHQAGVAGCEAFSSTVSRQARLPFAVDGAPGCVA